MRKPECDHKWVVLSENILPSAFEQIAKASAGRVRIGEVCEGTFQKKIVVILACEKCGSLDKTIEENP